MYLHLTLKWKTNQQTIQEQLLEKYTSNFECCYNPLFENTKFKIYWLLFHTNYKKDIHIVQKHYIAICNK